MISLHKCIYTYISNTNADQIQEVIKTYLRKERGNVDSLGRESKKAFERLHFLRIEPTVEKPGNVCIVRVVVEVRVCPGLQHQ